MGSRRGQKSYIVGPVQEKIIFQDFSVEEGPKLDNMERLLKVELQHFEPGITIQQIPVSKEHLGTEVVPFILDQILGAGANL